MPLRALTAPLVAGILAAEPGITQLSLRRNDIAVLEHLEPLGDTLTSLDVADNRLTSLCGLDTLPRLEQLDVSGNMLTTLFELPEATPQLQHVSAAHNELRSLTAVLPLTRLPFLRTLDLRGNPVTAAPGYRASVLRTLPRLQRLDNQDVCEAERAYHTLQRAEDEALAPQMLQRGAGVLGSAVAAETFAQDADPRTQRQDMVQDIADAEAYRTLRSEFQHQLDRVASDAAGKVRALQRSHNATVVALQEQVRAAEAETKRVRRYYHRFAEAPHASHHPNTSGSSVGSSDGSDSDDRAACVPETHALLQHQIDALQEILATQEATVDPAAGADGARQSLLSRWRGKVFQLMLQLRHQELQHEKAIADVQSQSRAARRDVAMLQQELDVVRARDHARSADLQVQRTAAQLAQATLEKTQARASRLAAALDVEQSVRRDLAQLAVQLSERVAAVEAAGHGTSRVLNGVQHRIDVASDNVRLLAATWHRRCVAAEATRDAALQDARQARHDLATGQAGLVQRLRQELDTARRDAALAAAQADTECQAMQRQHAADIAALRDDLAAAQSAADAARQDAAARTAALQQEMQQQVQASAGTLARLQDQLHQTQKAVRQREDQLQQAVQRAEREARAAAQARQHRAVLLQHLREQEAVLPVAVPTATPAEVITPTVAGAATVPAEDAKQGNTAPSRGSSVVDHVEALSKLSSQLLGSSG